MGNKVSVIIPTYNSEETIERCVLSIINQTYKDLEIIIVNDGSYDNTDSICEKLDKKDSRVIYIKKTNEGVANARNKGIEQVSGKFIMFVDADDYIDANLIEDLVENVKDYKIIKAGYKIIKNSKVKRTVNFNKVFSKEEFLKEILVGKIEGYCWGYLFDKELMNGIKMNEKTSHMEDTIFLVEIIKKVEQIPCIDTCYYNYDISEGSITRGKKELIGTLQEYLYAINEIDRIQNKEYNIFLEKKKAVLIERTLTKTQSLNELKKTTMEIKKIAEFDVKNLKNIYYKIILFLIKNNNFKILNSIMICRRILKKIKGM